MGINGFFKGAKDCLQTGNRATFSQSPTSFLFLVVDNENLVITEVILLNPSGIIIHGHPPPSHDTKEAPI